MPCVLVFSEVYSDATGKIPPKLYSFAEMSEQCVNSFVDSLEDLIEDSEFVAPNFTGNQVAFSLLKKYAKSVINGK